MDVAPTPTDVARVIGESHRLLAENHRLLEENRRLRAEAAELRHALSSRVVIEQAVGILAQKSLVPVGSAFVQLRDYARSRREPISAVATGIVAHLGRAS